MSKTCSTCRNRDKAYIQNCRKKNICIPDVLAEFMLCEHHDPIPQPMRLECECEWVEEVIIVETFPRKFAYPKWDGVLELRKFTGKRTRMTIEEIIE